MSAGKRVAVKIRRARPRDLEGFARNVQSVADEGRYIFTERVTAQRKRSTAKLFRDRSCLVAVAEVGRGRDARLVGNITLSRYGDVEKSKHVRVLGMLVLGGHRGLGIGTKLMQYALDWARSQPEIEKIALGVFSTNRVAFRLYQKFGFKVEGVKRRQYYLEGKHADEIEMALFLR